MSEKRLSSAEKKVYGYLVATVEARGFSPTRREIMLGTGLSGWNAGRALRNLQTVGLIYIKPHSPRAIRLMEYKLVKKEG